MKWIEKERTLDQRERISIWLWVIIFAFAACTVASLYTIELLAIPSCILFLVFLKIEIRNNTLMGELIKKEKLLKK